MMESLETGQCLWMVTNQNIFGFSVERLELLGKNDARDSKPIPLPLPFDFHLKLPKCDLRPFVFDSKIFFAGGSPDYSSIDYSSSDFSNKIYQLSDAGGTKLDIADVEAAGTIPNSPTLVYACEVENIQGNVYLLVHDPLSKERKLGFWVLPFGSSSEQWLRLPPPPTLSSYHPNKLDDNKPPFVHLPWWRSSVWKDKLILMAERDPLERKSRADRYIYYVYDTKNASEDDPWQRRDRPFSSLGHGCSSAIVAVSSLGNVGNCDVALTWTTTEDDISDHTSDVKIYALLVDNQDNVLRQECLDELCEVIPFSFTLGTIKVNFVDLGKGKVCVLIGGIKTRLKNPDPSPNPVLCVLVLKLGLVREEGQRFLSLDVLVNQVYDMLPYTWGNSNEAPERSFLSSFRPGMPFKHPYSQGSNSPRKEPKLASGTNPTNSRALLE